MRRYSALGLEMGVAVVVGLLIGAWLDRKLHTTPVLLIVFILLGIATGFRDLYRAARQAAREMADRSAEPPPTSRSDDDSR